MPRHTSKGTDMINFIKKFNTERIEVANHARRTADRAALIMNDDVVTFRELGSRTNALANGLLRLGIESGDRVSILMHNSPEIMRG